MGFAHIRKQNALQDTAALSGRLNMTEGMDSWMSSTGWDNSDPVKFKCTFGNLYFKTEEEKKRHIEENHSDY